MLIQQFQASPREKRLPRTCFGVVAILLVLVVGLGYGMRSHARAREGQKWSSCVQYERNLAAALESYNAQEKSYPTRLEGLTDGSPRYINALPSCPSSGSGHGYVADGRNKNFTIYCTGHHAPLCVPGYPQYSAMQGIRQRNASE